MGIFYLMELIKLTKVRILQIYRDSIVDGPGIRTVIFFAGCPHHCQGCQNPESWNPQSGKNLTIDQVIQYATQTKNNEITFSGGDPLGFQFDGALEIAKILKEKYHKNIWVYTGFLWEQIKKSHRLLKILPYIDALVDGRFILSKRDISLKFRGSSNQRIIDVRKSLEENKTILYLN